MGFKIAFINVKYSKKVGLPESFVKELPKKVILFTNVQLIDQYNSLKNQISNSGREVITVRPKHSWFDGQLLGCGMESWKEFDFDAFVYVGDGLFHPKALLINNNKKVFIYDPVNNQTRILEDRGDLAKRRKGALAAFYSSTVIGVLVTTKYGQSRIKRSLALQKKYPDKKFIYFLDDKIIPESLEDFPFVEVFVNTACPRMIDDHERFMKPLVNIEEITGDSW